MASNFGGASTNKPPALNFGSSSQPASTPSLFMSLPQKQTTTASATNPPPAKDNSTNSLFLGLPQKNATTTNTSGFAPAASTNPTNNPTSSAQPLSNLGDSTLSSGGPQIDVVHMRSTTKYDHLTPALQQDILGLDSLILNQITHCTEVADVLPAIISGGDQVAPGVDFVSGKLEELESGLENDAEAVVSLRDGDVQKDAGEAKCVFRTVDRLKVPRQYQIGNADVGAVPGFNGGLSGWWNQPAAFSRGTVRAAGAGSSVQILDDDPDEDEKSKGPKNLIELFNSRTKEMAETSAAHNKLLGDIEDFVGGLEEKVYSKERELNERLDNGATTNGEYGFQQEREHQMQLLKYVFGEVQRSLYEVAEKIGTVRDGVVDVTLKR